MFVLSKFMDSANFNRRSIRLPEYDYSWQGEYFVTICVHARECLLGKVVNGEMVVNEFGQIVQRCWKELPSHYAQLSLGEWVVMPNHMHGILIINDADVEAIPVGVIHELPLHESPMYKRRKMLLSKIIGRFKMNSGKQINLIRNLPGSSVWQRNYYEHIIRNGKSYIEIENYIRNNPLNWHTDGDNPVNIEIEKNKNRNV